MVLFDFTCFLLDGDSEFRSECAVALSNHGFRIVGQAADGQTALVKIKNLKPSLVIMDLMLAKCGGITVLSQLKESTDYSPIVMVITGQASKSLLQQASAFGVSYFLTKPVSGNTVAETVDKIYMSYEHNSKLKRNKQQTAKAHNLELQVTDIIHKMGIPAHILGYRYLRSAIMLAINDTNAMCSVTKILYPTVAKQHSTTPSRVERAIRHAIDLAWQRGDMNVISSYFGCTVSGVRGKPTNSEFIALISDNIRVKSKV